ncbi:TPA: YfdX family protein [Salmonella enterica subsp. enterica serovar Welikade]|nr:YfdX family protein [Salmonella enterica]EKB5042443.1 YfdX family protein [Salmonella enterica]EME1067518.1 YfdX family protein [Salmonella enterica]HEC8685153.1 YfdX family protein [Salmonella enterica subsp. enterica serovar Oranienburg]HEC9416528.1 YfdX family protein [Salmonella enterica subsp. enterica serovar Poona]
MKKHIIPVATLMFLLFSGSIMAAVKMDDNVTLNNEKISGQAWQAMRDVGMSRFALFNGQPQKAEKLASQAEKLLNDDSTDWSRYVKSDKTAPEKGDKYIRINSSITVAEDYLPSGPETDAITKANQKMKAGDKKGAIDALKLAGVSVIENQELIPLQQTRKDVNTALSLMSEGKYYQASLMLKSAQDSVIVDSQSVQESPAQPVKSSTAH